jgi:hypothetical protein
MTEWRNGKMVGFHDEVYVLEYDIIRNDDTKIEKLLLWRSPYRVALAAVAAATAAAAMVAAAGAATVLTSVFPPEPKKLTQHHNCMVR